MGSVYRRPGRSIWMMQYYRNGIRIRSSSETTSKMKAQRRCDDLETDLRRGLPITPDVGKIRFDDAAQDILADYANNEQSSVDDVDGRIRNHLAPFFRGWRLSEITTPDVRAYTQQRRDAGAAAGTVNRELAILKRMFTLAIQGGKLLYKPHIPLLQEHNTRTGFFERDAFESVRAHLPAALRPIVTVAYITGWRIDSEVLPLDWPRVDLTARELRLDPGTTKNDEGRIFPMSDELHLVLVEQRRAHDALAATGVICPWVFFRMVANGRRGPQTPKPIKRFNKAWASACRAAGQPGKIPHDFRRTAIRNMVRRGVPERVAMQLAGHKTRSVFDRYNIVSAGDLQEAATKLAGLGAGTLKGTPAAMPQLRLPGV
jgi:integrase